MMTEQRISSGQTLGRYELLVPVARGGMGQVWAARLRGGRGFQKLVAIKTILPLPGDEKRLEEMLLEEARLASQIQHANVVDIVELGEHDGTLYLVMEWVDGEPLNLIMTRALDQGGMPLPIAVNLIAQACRGLHAAHELCDESGQLLGVVHRDISPQNILITYSGTAKIVDFGIAKATNAKTSLTETGEIKGKFSYMSPEQILAAPVDRRADVFSMGIVLFILTTGRHPFKADNPAATVHSITSPKPVTKPSKLVSGYPRALENVVMKALAKVPDDRYATAQDLLAALQRAIPEAFEPGFEKEIETYLMNLVGERATRRREALRKAQDVADKWRLDTNAADQAQNPSNFSSLRAVALEKSAAEHASSASAKSIPALDSALKGVPRRSRFITPIGIAAALGGFIVAAALGSYLAPRAAHNASAAASPSAPTLAQVMSVRPEPSHPIPSASSAVPETLPAPTVEPAPVKPESLELEAKQQPKTTKAKPTSANVRKKPEPQTKPAQQTATGGELDLIAPDYAEAR